MRLEFYSDHVTVILSRRNLLALLIKAADPLSFGMLLSGDVWLDGDPIHGLLAVRVATANPSSVVIEGRLAHLVISVDTIRRLLDGLENEERPTESLGISSPDARPTLILAEGDDLHYEGRAAGAPGAMHPRTEQFLRLAGATPSDADLN